MANCHEMSGAIMKGNIVLVNALIDSTKEPKECEGCFTRRAVNYGHYEILQILLNHKFQIKDNEKKELFRNAGREIVDGIVVVLNDEEIKKRMDLDKMQVEKEACCKEIAQSNNQIKVLEGNIELLRERIKGINLKLGITNEEVVSRPIRKLDLED